MRLGGRVNVAEKSKKTAFHHGNTEITEKNIFCVKAERGS
jgi:hypothetical protein